MRYSNYTLNVMPNRFEPKRTGKKRKEPKIKIKNLDN